MADNRHKYGFRFYSSLTGVGRTAAVEFPVATSYPPVINTNVSVGLSIGDPVQILTDGSVALAGDTTTTGAVPFGVIVGLRGKVDANQKSRPASFLPTTLAYSTKENETRVQVLPFGRDLWEIDADDASTATTEAAYRALIGNNFDMVYLLDASNPDKRRANPMLDISGGGFGANTAHFRLFGISGTRENADFSGNFVKLLVQLNEGREPMFTATGL